MELGTFSVDFGPILEYFWLPGDPGGSVWALRGAEGTEAPEKVWKRGFVPHGPGPLAGTLWALFSVFVFSKK